MRSYPRSYGYRFDWRGMFTPAIKTLVIANAAVFLAQGFVAWERVGGSKAAYEGLIKWFGLIPSAVIPGLRIWQPFTYLFLHDGVWHLLMNMLVLWMFGRDLEMAWGKRRFYIYYFVCGVGAGLINIAAKSIPLFWGERLPDVATIGASGAIYGILIAMAMVFPDRQVWLIPFPIVLRMKVLVLIIGAIAFFSSLGSGDNISHISHLGGMLVGYVYLRRGSFFYGWRNFYTDWKRKRMKRKFEVYMRDSQDKPPTNPDHWVN